MSDTGKCVICDGKKIHLGHPCSFCNGTGEWNQTSESFLKDHICQCIHYGRKFCPVCNKKCHHDSSQTPKQRIEPGYGGMAATINTTTSSTVEPEPKQEEPMIVA
jgi:hypothetical protein